MATQAKEVFSHNWTCPYVVWVDVEEVLKWNLKNQTLAEALYYYAVNYADCPEWMKDYWRPQSIRTTYTNFIVKIESLPVEKKTVHNGNQRQDFIQKPGQDQWIKLHYGNPIAVNGCRKKHEPVQQD